MLREIRGLGRPTGMRLSDGSLWGSYRRSARTEVLVPLPTHQGAEDAWRGKPATVKAPRSSDWNPRTLKWSWEV